MVNNMLAIHVEDLKATLSKILSTMNLSLISGKEVEVRENVFMQLKGNLDFSIRSNSQGIEIVFKIQPQIRVRKIFNLFGDLTRVLIRKDGIILNIDGLPDIWLEAVS